MVVLNQVEHLQEPVRHDITRLKYHSAETYINFSNTLNSTYFPTPPLHRLGLEYFKFQNRN